MIPMYPCFMNDKDLNRREARRKIRETQFPCRVRDSVPTFSFLLQAERLVQRAEERGALVVFHQSGIGGFCGGNKFRPQTDYAIIA